MRWEILETPNFWNNNTSIYIHFSNFEYNNSLQLIYTVGLKEKMNQPTAQVNPQHIKIKGDLKSDDSEKKKDEIGFEKILERKQKHLKGIRKKKRGSKTIHSRTLDDEIQPNRG